MSRIEPKGTVEQRDAIGKAVEIVRGEHPYATAPRRIG